jgi:hypothetical protein
MPMPSNSTSENRKSLLAELARISYTFEKPEQTFNPRDIIRVAKIMLSAPERFAKLNPEHDDIMSVN